MKPDVPMVLAAMAGTLAMQVTPEVSTPFGEQTVGLSAMLVTILSQEFDRAAARLVAENAALEAILRDGRRVVTDLASRIEPALVGERQTDLLVSALQARNNDLRQLLIELQAAAEASSDPAAAELSAHIWDELRESTRRRHVATAV